MVTVNSVTVAEVRAFAQRLRQPVAGIDAETALGLIAALQECSNTAVAAQAALTVTVHEAQTATDRARGIAADESIRVVAAAVGLARRTGPRRGRTFVGVATAMGEMPHTRAALTAGVIGEWQAQLVVAATGFLSLADRQAVDEAVKEVLGRVSDRRLETVAQGAAYRADPEAFVARRAAAEKDRRVSLRPAPDCMTRLSALLPVADGVACLAALQAVTPVDGDDSRGRGQLMADALVQRITGRPARHAPQPSAESGNTVAEPHPPAAVNLLVPLESLTGHAEGFLEGFGAVPADVVRAFLADNEAAGGVIRRVFTAPESGQLVAMESRARRFSGLLAAFVRLRDQVCRTPFCGAGITQIDHVRAHAGGGETSAGNAAGTCQGCNLVKEHPDVRVSGDAEQFTVQIHGLRASSRPPTPPARRASACAERSYRRRITVRLPSPASRPVILRR